MKRTYFNKLENNRLQENSKYNFGSNKDAYVVGLNPIANDVRNTRAPGIREQSFDPSRVMVWPSQGSTYDNNTRRNAMVNYEELPDMMYDDRAQAVATMYLQDMRGWRETESIQMHNNRGSYSSVWTGMDLGGLAPGQQGSRVQWTPYRNPTQEQGQMFHHSSKV